ncbi:cyclin-G-associated kinase [Erinaceus europaeus]|uniref:Cyclin-G-associated kinase n=1 Tax=Erinaceus europaeus TaxID=9365 RepID=A0ABM3X6D9_ERIEU|nr:cyclin-G-associated kinase [Erinaceus europaeus]
MMRPEGRLGWVPVPRGGGPLTPPRPQQVRRSGGRERDAGLAGSAPEVRHAHPRHESSSGRTPRAVASRRPTSRRRRRGGRWGGPGPAVAERSGPGAAGPAAMSLLQSALDFLAGPGSLGAAGRDHTDFVGQTVELGELRLRVRRVLAEGGFAFVYEAQDLGSGQEYALKRLLSNEEEKNRAIIQEVCFLKKLSGHPNIIQFCSAASIGKEESDTGQAEFLLLTELCRGQLVEFLRKIEPRGPLSCDTVLKIFYQTCRAVQHMHRQKPPIIHRDLKVENLLLSNQGTIKLCDFGSATTISHYPDYSWSAQKRALVEEEVSGRTPTHRL